MSLLGLNMEDAFHEKKYHIAYHTTKHEHREDLSAFNMMARGKVYAAAALSSDHWNLVVKPEDRNIPTLVKQYEIELDNIHHFAESEPHRLHYEVFLKHHKRALMVYKAIADDHDMMTKSGLDKKPTDVQKDIRARLGAQQSTGNEEADGASSNYIDDTTMTGSSGTE